MPSLSRRALLGGMAAVPAAAQAEAAQLNIIHIGVDTWGTDWLGCYGRSFANTPNVDAFAARSTLFLQAFAEALPTLPARRALYTGRRVFPSDRYVQPDDTVRIRGWHPLFADDITLAEVAQAAGYTTGFISDVYHQFKPGKNFHRGFDSWRFIRGQEQDRLEAGPKKAIRISNYLHASQSGQRGMRNGPLQYLLNRRHWRTEEDWLASQVFREAARWLDAVHEESQPFYLHIESFSPHEYWDPPDDYYRMYMKSNYAGPRLIAPPATTKDMTPVEVEHVRALYGGLVTFVDAGIGKFLRRVEALGLMKNTVIVFVSDHGTMMGEQGQLHKGEQRLRRQVTQAPLAIYHPPAADKPSWAGRRIRGFVQHTDLMPTLLDIAGLKAPPRVTGESLKALQDSRRDSVITGWGDFGSVRTAEWNYIGRWNNAGPPFEELYHLSRDPAELENVAAGHPAVVSELRAKLKAHVDGGWPITRGSFARVG